MNKTQQKILDAAFVTLAQDFSAPLDKVAEVAGVTRMTLHRYFNGRNALLEAMVLEIARLSNQVFDKALADQQQPLAQLKAIVIEASQMGEQFHFLMHAAEEIPEETIAPLAEGLDGRMTAIIEILRAEGLVHAGVPTAWILHLYGGVLTAVWSAMRDGSVAPKDIPKLAWQSFANGFLIEEVND